MDLRRQSLREPEVEPSQRRDAREQLRRGCVPLSAGRRRCSAGQPLPAQQLYAFLASSREYPTRRSSLHRSGQLGATSHRASSSSAHSSMSILRSGWGRHESWYWRAAHTTGNCGLWTRKATRTRGCGWKEATHIRLRPCARHVSRSASEEAAARSRPRCDMSMTARYEYDGGENVGFSPPSYSSRRPSMGALLCRTRGHGAGCRTERRAH